MALRRAVRKGNLKKTGLLLIADLVVIGTVVLFIDEARSETEVSATIQVSAPADFYQPLGTCGTWTDVDGYGHCFQPAGVGPGWQPYCEGSWVWTDCGWYWQSGEPWAWACYHYGTWVDAPALFVFMDVNHFQDPVRRTSVTVNNAVAISQTRELAAPGRERRTIDGRTQEVVINRGPDVEAVQKASGRKLNLVPIGEARQKTAMPKNLAPSDRRAEPAKMNQPIEPDTGKPQPPTLDRRDENAPARQPDLAPEKPAETRQPSPDLPQRAPVQETPTPPPREGQQVPQQAPQKPPLKPVNPPKEEKPAPEEKPANPPPQQEKKDGLGRSSSMLADIQMVAPGTQE